MFGPEWPRLSTFKKLVMRGNAVYEEAPHDERAQQRALAFYAEALRLKPSPMVHANIGKIHFKRRDWDKAEVEFRRAGDHFWLGLLYEWTSRYDEAWEHIHQAPPSADQARVLARISRHTGREKEGIRALLPWNDVDSLFELIQLYDSVGEYEKAWATSLKANTAKGKRNENPVPALDYEVPKERHAAAPVLIVGMPRSGTTLLERMLAQHPDIETRGESLFFDFIAGQLAEGKAIAHIGDAYLMSHAGRTVDKHPMNFQHLDLIRGVFPEAKIIDMRRNREDTLLSCWFRNFKGDLDWAYNWDDLHRAYDRYMETMEGRDDVLTVRYEQLVLNPEAVLREVLDHCDLYWHEGCLQHNADPTFHDYSYVEARRPIFRDHIGRADRYRDFFPRVMGLEASA